MPYIIINSKKGSKRGYRVRTLNRTKDGIFHYFSSYPLTWEMANKQLKALHINTYK
jgi:hypothetical protein